MQRTRAAILDAAADCVERQGVRHTTMGELARTGGVAKATLYNHFRSKDDVLSALVEARVAALALQCRALSGDERQVPDAATGLAAALAHAADVLAASRPLRRVAADEPALLAPLAVPAQGRAWGGVREGVAAVLLAAGAAADPARVELVLRWLLSGLLWPTGSALQQAELLVTALAAEGSGPAVAGRAQESPRWSGLGWPPAT